MGGIWWVYIIEKSGNFYVGITTDLENRLRQHGQLSLLYKEGPMSNMEADLSYPQKNSLIFCLHELSHVLQYPIRNQRRS